MSEKHTLHDLKTDLVHLFMRYGLSQIQADEFVAQIWGEVVEATDFASFVRERLDPAQQGTDEAIIADPLADLDPASREALLRERIAQMDETQREGLLRSLGSWADDVR